MQKRSPPQEPPEGNPYIITWTPTQVLSLFKYEIFANLRLKPWYLNTHKSNLHLLYLSAGDHPASVHLHQEPSLQPRVQPLRGGLGQWRGGQLQGHKVRTTDQTTVAVQWHSFQL